ncbi:MAG: GldG family protein [Candidatus Krumholzibacteria bacterium]|nr:GldG family protein [Candidatus Krumholzibacteria bacterium]
MKDNLRKIIGPTGLILTVIGSVIYGILFESGWIAFIPLFAGLTLSILALIIEVRVSSSEGRRRSARFGINTGVTIVVVAALLFFAQTLSKRHSLRIDTTSNRRFSISLQTAKVLKNLKDDIRFTCFFREGVPEKTEVFDLLSEYRVTTPKISFRFIDPDQDPITARRYELKDYNNIYIESGDRIDLLENWSEQRITNAIKAILSGGRKKVYFTTGHGERSIEDKEPSGLSSLAEALRIENFETADFLPLGSDKIPSDCKLLVIAGPKKDILRPERNLIFDYLTSGGNILLLLDPIAEIPYIVSVASAFGIGVGDDIIIDTFGKTLAGNYLTPVVNQYGTHPITDQFRLFSFFPQARSINVRENLPDGVIVTILGKTDDEAYAETSIDTLLNIGKTQFEAPDDLPGPISLIAAGEMGLPPAPGDTLFDSPEKKTRAVVFGDSDFTANGNIRLSGNRDLILNTINWLAEEEDLISIRPADRLNQPVLLSSRQGLVVFWLSVIGFPALFALAGLFVTLRIRRSD